MTLLFLPAILFFSRNFILTLFSCLDITISSSVIASHYSTYPHLPMKTYSSMEKSLQTSYIKNFRVKSLLVQ